MRFVTKNKENFTMNRNKSKIALIFSLGIHFVLMLVLSPFLIKHFDEPDDDLSLVIYRPGISDQMKRHLMRQHKTAQLKRSTESGSTAISPAAPKYAPKMDTSIAPIRDDLAPDIVTNVDIPKTDAYTLPNMSFGTNEAAGPVVIPEFQGAGGRAVGPGRGRGTGQSGTGSGSGGGMNNDLSRLQGIGELSSFDLGENLENLIGLGIFNTKVKPGHGVIGQVYIPGYPIYNMPVFERFTPVYTFATAKLDVAPRDYIQGFPTPEKQGVVENFAIHFRGKLAVDTPGIHMFEIYSDDGAKLYINGELVLDNDGVHAPKTKRAYVALTAGFHPFEIHYFQGPRYSIALQWYYKPPNRPRQIVPPEVIFHPNKPDAPGELRKFSQQMKKLGK
jgi:hypothetical protein